MKWNFPSHYRLVPEKHLKARVENAAALCRSLGLGGMLFTRATDIFYLSGTTQQGAVFVGGNGEIRVFIKRVAERAQAESPFEVTPVTGFSQIAVELGLSQGFQLGLTLDVMSAQEYLGWQKRMGGAVLSDCSAPWQNLKAVKDAWEIKALTKAGAIAVDMFAEASRLIKPGVSEAWVAGQMLAVGMDLGGMNLVRSRSPFLENFTWQLVSGPPASLPSSIDTPFGGVGVSPAFPTGASVKKMEKGELVVVDVASCYEGYISDQTRTYVLGKPSDRARRAYDALVAIEKAILEMLRPGVAGGAVYSRSMEVAEQMGALDSFMGRPGGKVKFVGHGVGLELGAAPYLIKGSDTRVRAHEAYALELKMVLEEGALGLENSLVVNPDGPPTIFSPIPDELMEIH